ncbi:putative mitochondrial export protein Som1 [Lyophyllum shimeji]|uniref:Mitochondrial export protein Som1 n=1 Tax=Lyophyllum shimeji TaxID=47721 RepID=A0A9P3UNF8_LYOSH|nr:putative mitochondrial export protein Som1 [Lyophyllum shimeji]
MASEGLPGKCRISEILQYTCDVDTSGPTPEVQCFPIPRIFRICPGRPTVEITKLVNVNMITGEVEVPADACDVPVQGKPWRAITRCNRDPEAVSNKQDQ